MFYSYVNERFWEKKVGITFKANAPLMIPYWWKSEITFHALEYIMVWNDKSVIENITFFQSAVALLTILNNDNIISVRKMALERYKKHPERNHMSEEEENIILRY